MDFELGDAVFFARGDFKAKSVKYEYLTFGRYHLCFMDNQAGECVGLVIRQAPILRPVQIANGHGSINDNMTVLRRSDPLVAGVKFVGDLADDFLQNIFQGDEPLQSAILIHNQGEMRVTL